MKNIISNDNITFVSDSYNIEPWSLKFNDDDVNYFWRPESVKELGAAVCFPLLGALPNNKYTLDGKEYEMDTHGFARLHDFNVAEKSKTSVTYEITGSEKTMRQYPYKFRFRVIYSLENTALKTEYKVTNQDTKAMYFSVGGHPRFACPIGGEDSGISFEDYYAEFEQPESIKNIVKSYGPVGVIEKFLSVGGRRISLDYSMFTEGCFCFHPVNSKYLVLKSDKSPRSLTLRMDTVTHLQFWTVPGGKFIAFEPWYGSITSIPPKAAESNWKERPGTLCIDPGEEFSCAYYAAIAK
jgi:galactose mutarotase-like enzyme